MESRQSSSPPLTASLTVPVGTGQPWSGSYLQVGQRHLGRAELTGGLSVFTFPGQVVRNVFPHHSFFTFAQRTGNLKEWTHVQVLLRKDRQTGGVTLTGSHIQSDGGILSAYAHGYLLQTHLLLTAVSFAATVYLQGHNFSMAANISKDLKQNPHRSR